MKVRTLNSTYEILDGHRIRKVEGGPPMAGFEANEYAQHISTPAVGRPLVVVWYHGEDRSHCTFTSSVTEILAGEG